MSKASSSSITHHKILLEEMRYRSPMRIEEVMVFDTTHEPDGFYVCPRCNSTLEREYTAFCDRCGQRLDWCGIRRAKVIRPGQKRQNP